MRKEIALNAKNLAEYINFLSNATEGGYADNDGRTVNVMEWSGGRYELVSKDGDSLACTDDVFSAVWFLKTGEWVAKNGKLYIDSEEAVDDGDEEEEDEDDEDYIDEPSSADLEMGFNPYMGCCDYDC